jgi:hypothetical protein
LAADQADRGSRGAISSIVRPASSARGRLSIQPQQISSSTACGHGSQSGWWRRNVTSQCAAAEA